MSFSAYKNMKPSGDSWLGDIPSHWESAPLKAMARVDNSGCYGLDPEEPGKVLPVATTAQIGSDGSFDVDRMPQRAFTPSEVERYSCREGDILVVKSSGSAENIISGKAGYISPETPTFIFSNFLMRLVPFKGVAFPKFVYLLLVSHLTRERIKQMCSTTTYPNLQVGLYSGAKLPCPPSDEQQKIAAFLDYETAKIDALIAEQQRLIELLKEKRQAVISHAVTKGLNPNAPMKDSGVEWLGEVPAHWGVSRLKFVSTIVDCKNRTPEYVDDGEYLVVRTSNIKNQQLDLSGALYTDHKNYKTWTLRGVPPEGSILFTREAPAGEVCLVPKGVPLCMGQRMMNIIPDEVGYTPFLFDYLTSDCLVRYIEAEAAGSTVTHLRVEQVYNIPVVVPPLEEQRQIDIVIRKMKASFLTLIDQAQNSVGLLKERRSSLISAAVTGKIDVRGWQPSMSIRPGEELQSADESAVNG